MMIAPEGMIMAGRWNGQCFGLVGSGVVSGLPVTRSERISRRFREML
jgi:hypothetical protein